MESYSVDVVLICFPPGPPVPPILRYGAIFRAMATLSPPMPHARPTSISNTTQARPYS